MAEDFGAFVDSPVASDTGYARMQRRYAPDGVVQDGPDAGGQLTVTGTATSQLTISSGYAHVGGWFYRTDTSVTVNVDPNPSSAARRDLVVIRADTGEAACYPHIITGTPGSSTWPTPTRDPSGVWDVVLARVTVQGGSAVVAPADVDTTVREWTVPSGAIPCTSTSRPVDPFEGMTICETDTGRVLVHVDGAWRTVADTGYPTSWQPITLRAGFTTPGHGRTPSWRWLAPNRVELRGTISRSGGGPLPSADYYARVPTQARPEAMHRQAVATESRNSAGTYGSTARLDVASTGTTSHLPGQLVGFHAHGPHWIALDGVVYDL